MTRKLYPDAPVLIVEDEVSVLEAYRTTLRLKQINNVVLCTTCEQARDVFMKKAVSVVVLDLNLPTTPGDVFLEQVRCRHPSVPVIIVTASNEVNTAVSCMKKGAFDYLVKPVDEGPLISVIKNAIELHELRNENRSLTRKLLTSGLSSPSVFEPIVTANPDMHALFRYVEAIAPSTLPVLITGESGVGKELFARAVHEASGRTGPFVPVNVAGVDDMAFSDTLFGHRKGAFTGADRARNGLVDEARGGTLFLDEIGTLDMSAQVKLLRLLQEKEYYALGSDLRKTTDAAVVAATNVNLRERVERELFRGDLYYRLHVHRLHIPPLRERPEDIPLLAEKFVRGAAETLRKSAPKLPDQTLELLRSYTYPGNVRELHSLIHDAVSRCRSGVLDVSLFDTPLPGSGQRLAGSVGRGRKGGKIICTEGPLPLLKDVEAQLMQEAMRRTRGNQSLAAQLLGVSQSTVSRRFGAGRADEAETLGT
jgi:DNA-binding NtrC family response regulator